MTGLISAELLKARTTRALPITAVLLVLATVGLGIQAGLLSGQDDIPELTADALGMFLAGLAQVTGGAALLLGLFASAGEYRHRTILTTSLAEPRPLRVLGAKVTAMGLVGFGLGALGAGTGLLTGVGVLASSGVPVDLTAPGVLRLLVAVPLLTAGHAVVGVAVGMLVRNLTAAVGVCLGWATLVEGVLPVLTRTPKLAYWLPTNGVKAVLEWGDGAAGQLAPGIAVAVLAAYVAALVLAAAAAGRREVA